MIGEFNCEFLYKFDSLPTAVAIIGRQIGRLMCVIRANIGMNVISPPAGFRAEIALGVTLIFARGAPNRPATNPAVITRLIRAQFGSK